MSFFKEDTKILTIKGYIAIQKLRKGNLVKTYKNDYIPIAAINKSEFYHMCFDGRIKDQLYKCTQNNYPEIFEDLIITGCNSILVDTFNSKKQLQKTIQINGKISTYNSKYLLPVCADERSSIYEMPGEYSIYDLILENDESCTCYGIYANGLLVESTYKNYVKYLSNLSLIEN
jgi:hypothetical protein